MKLVPSFLLLAAALAGCSRHASPESAAASLPAVQVRTTTVRAEDLATLNEVTGTVRPVQRAQLAAKVMGAIEELPVALGQRVRASDLLVKISAAEINARVVQARSQLNAARRDLDRERDLLAKGASTADLVRGLEDRFAGAEAMVREAEAMLGYATLRAPFDGVISRKFVNAGDLASPGFPLLEIEGTSDFQVEAGLPDSLAARLAVGAPLAVELPAAGLTFTGTLAELSSAADSGARTVTAKIAVPAGTAVRSGQFARVLVPGAAVRTLLVPAAAVSTLGQMERVFVVGGDHRAVLRFVKTGATRGDRIEILAGLDDGERLVVGAPASLREGQPLEILP
jgi:RND family efflux transporter MFP subunit